MVTYCVLSRKGVKRSFFSLLWKPRHPRRETSPPRPAACLVRRADPLRELPRRRSRSSALISWRRGAAAGRPRPPPAQPLDSPPLT